MIRGLSDKAAGFLFRKNADEGKVELYGYAIYILLSSALHIASIAAIGCLLSMPAESLVFYASFIAIRKFAGGYHAKTPLRCYLFSVPTSAAALVAVKSAELYFSTVLMYSVIAVNLLCVTAIFALSPLDTESKKLSPKERTVYKKVSATISSILFIASTILLLKNIAAIGLPIVGGIVMSTLVLVMRKIQMLKSRGTAD